MDQKQKQDIIVGIIFVMVIVGIGVGIVNFIDSKQRVSIGGGIDVSQQSYEDINNFVEEEGYLDYYVCNIKTEDCSYLTNVNQLEEYHKSLE